MNKCTLPRRKVYSSKIDHDTLVEKLRAAAADSIHPDEYRPQIPQNKTIPDNRGRHKTKYKPPENEPHTITLTLEEAIAFSVKDGERAYLREFERHPYADPILLERLLGQFGHHFLTHNLSHDAFDDVYDDLLGHLLRNEHLDSLAFERNSDKQTGA